MTRQRPDPYAVLGLRSGASRAEVTHAYRALLRRHHPDTRGEAPGTPTDSDASLGQVIAAYAQLRHAEPVETPTRRPAATPPQGRSDASHAPIDDRSPIRAGPVRWQASPAGDAAPTEPEEALGDDLLSAALRWLRR